MNVHAGGKVECDLIFTAQHPAVPEKSPAGALKQMLRIDVLVIW